MKKIISFVLVLTLVFSCVSLTFSHAADSPVLTNASYSVEDTQQYAIFNAADETDDEEPTTEEPEEPGEISFLQGIIIAIKTIFANINNNGGTAALMDALFDALKDTGLDIVVFYIWFLSSGILQWFAAIFLK